MIMALVSPLVLASSPIVIEDTEGILKLRNAIYVEEYLAFGPGEESDEKKCPSTTPLCWSSKKASKSLRATS